MSEKNLSFEQALARLEEIVGLLDNGSAPLDKSLELFEEGAGLVKLCSSMLDNVEQRVKILVSGENGSIEQKDFKPVNE
ncbi:MAG: exodeoxyribonuclease VII small subunit [Clostridia bacterium]|nr:exodeoxyribonuclease VII small subunit [Clostridia bacterium]